MIYDAAIIGAGITGTAIARELSKYDLKTVVLEKSYDISNGSTKANSGIVHAGYDALPGTLKAKFNVEGNAMYDSLCSELDVQFKRIGSLVVAFNEKETLKVKELYERGLKNKVPGMEILERGALFKIEPNLNENAVCALYAKTAGIVSPYELAIALAENAGQNGVEFKLETEVLSILKNEKSFIIETGNGKIESRYIVNAAGIESDVINNMLNGKKFSIIPRRGEYCLLDKASGNLVNKVIFQVPNEKGKGILVTPTVHGNLLIGPNAAEIDDKGDKSTTSDGLNQVITGAKKSIKGLNTRDIITSFSGIRATPDTGDFIINVPEKNVVNVAGIESPGLTSAPAIAKYVVKLLKTEGLDLALKVNFIPNRINTKKFYEMNDIERNEAINKNSEYGRIICRCEKVTEGDIVNSIKRPLGARTVDGVKKRVRAGMGRCQGGFCMPRVVDILSRELGVDKSEILKSGTGSYILTGRTK